MISNTTPVYAVPDEKLVPVNDHLSRMMDIPPSRMFLIKNSLKVYVDKNLGSPIYDASQGDGGASLPMGYREASRTIVEPTNASRVLLKKLLDESGLQHITGKGYYAFINVSEFLRTKGWDDSEPLGQYLGENYGVAIVPGAYFSPFGSELGAFFICHAP